MNAVAARFSVCALLVGGVVLAEEAKVEVMAEVVLASNNDQVIEPPELAKVKEKFAKEGLSFSSYRRVSAEKVSLVKGKTSQLALPNQGHASVKLEELKDGVARLRVEIPKLVSTTLTLGKEGTLFQYAGNHQGGKLVLVLSPVGGTQR